MDKITVTLPRETWAVIRGALEESTESRQHELEHGEHDERQQAENEQAHNDYTAALADLESALESK